jgi:hypothetical protein
MPDQIPTPTRRYPDLPEAFEFNIRKAIEIGKEIGREYVMLDNGDIVPRAQVRGASRSSNQPNVRGS